MRAMSEKKKDMQIRMFTEKLCIVLIICGAMFLIAGWISNWLWQGLLAWLLTLLLSGNMQH